MWTDNTLEEDFDVTSKGIGTVFARVKDNPKREFLQEHAGRKAKLSINLVDGKRVYGDFRREFL